MNKDIGEQLINDLEQECKTIRNSKSKDYADDNILSNFQRLSDASLALQIDTRTPVGCSLFMCLMKIDRINNILTKGDTPENESIQDSFKDLKNYVNLTYLNYVEEYQTEINLNEL